MHRFLWLLVVVWAVGEVAAGAEHAGWSATQGGPQGNFFYEPAGEASDWKSWTFVVADEHHEQQPIIDLVPSAYSLIVHTRDWVEVSYAHGTASYPFGSGSLPNLLELVSYGARVFFMENSTSSSGVSNPLLCGDNFQPSVRSDLFCKSPRASYSSIAAVGDVECSSAGCGNSKIFAANSVPVPATEHTNSTFLVDVLTAVEIDPVASIVLPVQCTSLTPDPFNIDSAFCPGLDGNLYQVTTRGANAVASFTPPSSAAAMGRATTSQNGRMVFLTSVNGLQAWSYPPIANPGGSTTVLGQLWWHYFYAATRQIALDDEAGLVFAIGRMDATEQANSLWCFNINTGAILSRTELAQGGEISLHLLHRVAFVTRSTGVTVLSYSSAGAVTLTKEMRFERRQDFAKIITSPAGYYIAMSSFQCSQVSFTSFLPLDLPTCSSSSSSVQDPTVFALSLWLPLAVCACFACCICCICIRRKSKQQGQMKHAALVEDVPTGIALADVKVAELKV